MLEESKTIDIDTIQKAELLIQIDYSNKFNESLTNSIREKEIEINRHIRVNEGIPDDMLNRDERNKNKYNRIILSNNQLGDQGNSNLINKQKAKINQLKQEIIHLKESNEECRVKSCELSSLNQKEENEKNELMEIKEKLINMLTEKEIELIELKREIETLQSENKNNDFDNKYDELEQEYEQYKQKKEEQFELFRKEIEEMRSNEVSSRAKLDDLEYDNTCLQEEIQLYEIEKEQYDFQIKSLTDVQNRKYVYQNEIEALQLQIHNLTESKDQLIQNSLIETNNALHQRNEFEKLYIQTKQQKDELNDQMNKLKESIIINQQDLKETFDKELMMKNKVIDQLEELFEKKDEKIIELEKIIAKNENQSKATNDLFNQLKANNEKGKKEGEAIVKEIQLKNDKEINDFKIKIKELIHKIEDNNKDKANANKINSSLIHLVDENKDSKQTEDIIAKDQLINNLLQEKKYYEKVVNELLQSSSRVNMELLNAEKNYLDKTVDSLKNQIETIKAQRERDIKYYESELKYSIDDSIKLKLELATLALETDKELLRYKKLLKC